MKKTQRKDAVRNIKRRIVSYLSICLVITLGMGGFLVTRVTGAGIEDKATEYFAERNLKGIEMVSSMGVSDEDLAEIRAVEGVSDVEGVMQGEGRLGKDKTKTKVTIISLTERISVPELAEGEIPKADNECMIGEDFAKEYEIGIGDSVKISMTGIGDKKLLKNEDFTVTGLMHHPDYVRRKSVNTVTLPLNAFDEKATEGYFTRLFVDTDIDPNIGIFTDAYFDAEEETRKSLEGLTDRLAREDEARLRSKAEEKINEEWEKAKKEFEDAEKEIDENEKKLNDELAKTKAELEEAEKELAAKVTEGEEELRNAEATLNSELAKAKTELDELEAKLEEANEIWDAFRAIFGKDKEDRIRALIGRYESLDLSVKAARKDVAEFLIDNEDTIRQLRDLALSDELMRIAKEAQDDLGVEVYDALKTIREIDVDYMVETAAEYIEYYGRADRETEESEGEGEIPEDPSLEERIQEVMRTVNSIILQTKEFLTALDEVDLILDDMNTQLGNGKAELIRKEKEGRDRIAEGWATLEEEKAEAEKKIADGWAEYNAAKEKYEKEIAEARKKLEEERKKAEENVKEAKESLVIPACKWIVLDRTANAGYADVKSNLKAIDSLAFIFGLLFLLITAMVCLSTLIIVIEDQKTMVGTVKAFGFRKNEVLAKYLAFGVSAGIVGCILGIILAVSVSDMIQRIFAGTGMYQFGIARSIVEPIPAAIGVVLIIGICIIATIIACMDVLRSPAAVLMKGGKTRKSKKEKKTVSGHSGSLYSRLIVRNMLQDKPRVIGSIMIIVFSCLLVGTGLSLKLGFSETPERQIAEVNKFDLRVDLGGSVTEEQREKIEKDLEEKGVSFLPIMYKTHLYRWDEKLNGLSILAGDPERIIDYFGVNDPGTGNAISVPEDGILIQNKMMESYGMNVGDELPILSDSLDECPIKIVGAFRNYVGRTVIMTPDTYAKLFGTKYETNSILVNADENGKEETRNAVLSVTDDVSFEDKEDFSTRFDAASTVYNIIVYVTVGIAVLMSFMILTNLGNILVNRKKTELIVMRVNGFSISKTIGYLALETVLTTAIGIALSVALGAVLTPIIIKQTEQPDLQFIRDFHPVAWIIAIVLEIIFAVIINSVVFSRIKKFNLKDIT